MSLRERLSRKFRAFVGLPLREQIATFYVIGVAALVETGLRILPLPRLARLLGLRLEEERRGEPRIAQESRNSLTPIEAARLRAAALVFRNWPLGSGHCLRRSLVLGSILQHRAPVLRIGVKRAGGSGPLSAHAWIELDSSPLGESPTRAGFVVLRSRGGTLG